MHSSAPLREAKPEWHQVPTGIKTLLEEALHSRILEVEIAWGGYSPSASYLARLENGQRIFIKGVHPGQTATGVAAFMAEQRAYDTYPQLSVIAPRYLCHVQMDDWCLMALEAIEAGEPVLPWTTHKLEKVFGALNTLAALIPRKTEAMPLLHEGPDMADIAGGKCGWSMLRESVGLETLIPLFADEAAGQAWLQLALPQLTAHESRVPDLRGRHQPLHVDLRSDNILFRVDGRAVILDWPNLSWGPLVYDLAYFVNTVVVDGFGIHEDVLALAAKVTGETFPATDLKICAANLTGYFAGRGIRPEIPGLPRVRRHQRAQFFASLPWLARLFGLPPPPEPRKS